MLTLSAVLWLGIGSYLLRITGLALLSREQVPRWAEEPLRLLPPAILAALTVSLVMPADGDVLDPRLLGVGVAGFLVWRRAPLVVAMLTAAALTALLRLFT